MSSIVVAGDVSGAITIAAPAVAGSGTLTLPVATDTLVGKATTDTLTNKSIAATQLTGTIAAARLPAGSVLQVVSTAKTDTFSLAATTTFTDVTGLTVTTAALRSTASRVFISVALGRVSHSAAGTYSIAFRLMRGATVIAVADAAGSRPRASFATTSATDTNHSLGASFSWVDSPSSTSAETYKLQMTVQAAGTGYINRTGGDSDGAEVYQSRAASSITVMEIQG
jgi:hypothetical protein